MKIIDRCFHCDKMLFPWLKKPATISLYCADGNIEKPLCPECEQAIEGFAEKINDMIQENEENEKAYKK